MKYKNYFWRNGMLSGLIVPTKIYLSASGNLFLTVFIYFISQASGNIW